MGPSVPATHIGLARQVAEFVWRQHFRIPEPIYWLVLLVCAVGFSSATTLEAMAWLGVLLLSIVGIARWHWHRRRSKALVVTRFSAVRGQEGMAVRVQELVMTALQDKLPPDMLPLVHAVPAVAGTADRDFAVRLRRRLRSLYLVHGRVEQRADGAWAVFARVVQPAERAVKHADWQTRDITPARARWAPLFELLTPAKEVVAEEYPLEFANELEAIVRGVAGQVAALFEDDERAEPLLRAAVGKAPHSTSHQIDQLRIALARVLDRRGHRNEALQIFRNRANGEDPSPALLREIHAFLGPQIGSVGDVSDADAAEAIAALRRAATDDTDPQLDMTLYNLAMMLRVQPGEAEKQEADRILDELMRTSSFYGRTWYVAYERGAWHYSLASAAAERGDRDTARRHYKRAAKLYSRALRARPKARWLWQDGPRIWLRKRFLRSPIMYANATDAHAGAGHRLRAAWHEWMFQHLRRRRLDAAYKSFAARDWDAAYGYFEWAIVGRWDPTEVAARTMLALVTRQRGEDELAERYWNEVAARAPDVALPLRAAIANQMQPPLDRGVPGSEPTD